MPKIDVEGRSLAIQDIAHWFDYEHLSSPQREFSQQVYDLAANMVNDLPDSEELYNGLRKLLEAKDSFVRASVLLEETRRRQADEGQEKRKEDIVKQSADVNQYFDR